MCLRVMQIKLVVVVVAYITLRCWSDKASMSSKSIPKVDLSYWSKCSGGSRPSNKGGVHPDPEITGGGGGAVSKEFFSALRLR